MNMLNPGGYNKNLTGKKVYSSGSYAPTRGQVDPRGYIQRELRKQNRTQTSAAPSNSRSGLAAAALRKVKGSTPSKYSASKGGVPKPKPGSKGATEHQAFAPSYTPLKSSDRGGRPPGGVVGPGPKTPVGGTTPGSEAGTPATETPAEIPHVNIDSNGMLSLPFDLEVAQGVRQAQIDMNNQLLQLQMQQQQQALEYAQSRRDLGINQQLAERQNLNENAARGMAFSSQYGNHVNQTATAFNNAFTDLDQQNALGINQANMTRTQIQNAFNQLLQDYAMQRALKLAPDAGTLGLGAPADPITPNAPNLPGGGKKNGGKNGGKGQGSLKGNNKTPKGGKKKDGKKKKKLGAKVHTNTPNWIKSVNNFAPYSHALNSHIKDLASM